MAAVASPFFVSNQASTSLIFSSEFKSLRKQSSSSSRPPFGSSLSNSSSKIFFMGVANTKRQRGLEIAPKSYPFAVRDVSDTHKSLDYGNLAVELEHASPLRIIDEALRIFGNDIAIAFSGAEDVALLEYARLTGRPFRVISLDTGRLNPETYRFFDRVEKHYDIHIEYVFPEAEEVQNLVREKGLFSFYEDGHQECCRVRKVRPLRKALKNLRAWITGQRKDQSPGTRASIPTVHLDPSFEGLSGGPNSLVKWNPLANMESRDLWGFLRALDVPVNSLHSEGFISIGCEPCTRAVQPGQHEREGRWWWEDAKAKECGLHKSNAVISNGVSSVNGVVPSDGGDLFKGGEAEALSMAEMEKMVMMGERRDPWLVVLYAPWCRFCQSMDSEFVELAVKLAASGVRVGKFRADGGEERVFAEKELNFQTFPTILFLPQHSRTPIKYSSEKRDVDSMMAFVKAVK